MRGVTNYPPSVARKEYRTVRKTVLVDSRDRSPHQTQTSYSVDLPRVLDNVRAITLKSYEIPISWYEFTAAKGNTSFSATVSSTPPDTHTITIRDGNYSAAELADELERVLNIAFGSGEFTVEHNTTTGSPQFAFTFRNTHYEFTFDFTAAQNQANCGANVNVRSTASYYGLGYFMGFFQTPTVSSTSFTLVSSFPAQVFPTNYIIMEIDGINKQDETSIDGRLAGRPDGCFAKLLMAGNTGDVMIYNEQAAVPLNRSVLNPPQRIKTLNIKFRFHDGTPVLFNNVDHSFTLDIECLENGFDEYSTLDFAH